MFPIRKFLATFVFWCAFSVLAEGDVTRVEAQYVDGFSFANPIRDSSGSPLTAGTSGNGDGAVIQIGYFQGVSVSLDPSSYGAAEWAQFAPLTGVGSPNASRHPTSIGDSDSLASGPFGFFFIPSAVVIEFDTNEDLGLPGTYPVRLGIRFFDGTSVGGSTEFNTVTSADSLWLLQPPEPNPSSNSALNMDTHSLVWQSGAAGAFQTSIVLVPEPELGGLVLLGACLLAWRRHRQGPRKAEL